jgi:hypothetical protein
MSSRSRRNPHPFVHIGDMQRGYERSAESTMLEIQTLLPGVVHTAIEHGGDFLWRMTERNAHRLDWGREAVINKAERILRQINAQKPGGSTMRFAKELEENIQAASEYTGKPPAWIRTRLDRLLHLYVRQHAALPVYNRAQKMARDASVAIGTAMLKRRLEHAEPALRRLVKAARRKQTWIKEAGSMSLTPQKKTNPRRRTNMPKDPTYHGTVERPERVPLKPVDGDTVVVWRDEYNRWECWIYDSFNKHWSYAGQGNRLAMIAMAKDIVA